MTQLLLDALHMVDLVRGCIGAWADWLVILHPEVDARDRVLARKHTDLMRGRVLEARRGRVEDNHLVVLLDYALHLFLESLLILQHLLALHDVKLCV